VAIERASNQRSRDFLVVHGLPPMAVSSKYIHFDIIWEVPKPAIVQVFVFLLLT